MLEKFILRAEIEQDVEYFPEHTSIGMGFLDVNTNIFTFNNIRETNYLDEEKQDSLVFDLGDLGGIKLNLYVHFNNEVISFLDINLDTYSLKNKIIDLSHLTELDSLYSMVLSKKLNDEIPTKKEINKNKI